MTDCSVKGCRNRSEHLRTNTGGKVSFHSFPKDENHCAKWIKACGTENISINTGKNTKGLIHNISFLFQYNTISLLLLLLKLNYHQFIKRHLFFFKFTLFKNKKL